MAACGFQGRRCGVAVGMHHMGLQGHADLVHEQPAGLLGMQQRRRQRASQVVDHRVARPCAARQLEADVVEGRPVVASPLVAQVGDGHHAFRLPARLDDDAEGILHRDGRAGRQVVAVAAHARDRHVGGLDLDALRHAGLSSGAGGARPRAGRRPCWRRRGSGGPDPKNRSRRRSRPPSGRSSGASAWRSQRGVQAASGAASYPPSGGRP
ncbi:hypothetical protein G6F22_016592 [Rhizopus arrhizus]|nr:hypothetical protein G6F22_016592 [Rhizopus arrhizus]